jgi:hypothetical protein
MFEPSPLPHSFCRFSFARPIFSGAINYLHIFLFDSVLFISFSFQVFGSISCLFIYL